MSQLRLKRDFKPHDWESPLNEINNTGRPCRSGCFLFAAVHSLPDVCDGDLGRPNHPLGEVGEGELKNLKPGCTLHRRTTSALRESDSVDQKLGR